MRVHQSLTDDCLRKMQYSIESNVYHGGSVRAVGSAYHKALENYALDRIDHGYFEPDEAELSGLVFIAHQEFDRISAGGTSHISEATRERGDFRWDEKFPDRETAHAGIEKMVRSYFEGKHYWPEEWTYLGSEIPFELPWFGEHTRGGSMDLVLEGPDGGILVDDQKTAGRKWDQGKSSPRKKGQAAWYLWAAMDLWPGRPSYRFTYSIMTYTGQFERREATPTPAQINAHAQRMADLVTTYVVVRANGAELPANPASTLCNSKWCDFFSVCPFGAPVDA